MNDLEFFEKVAAPLCGIALAVVVVAAGAEVTATIQSLFN